MIFLQFFYYRKGIELKEKLGRDKKYQETKYLKKVLLIII